MVICVSQHCLFVIDNNRKVIWTMTCNYYQLSNIQDRVTRNVWRGKENAFSINIFAIRRLKRFFVLGFHLRPMQNWLLQKCRMIRQNQLSLKNLSCILGYKCLALQILFGSRDTTNNKLRKKFPLQIISRYFEYEICLKDLIIHSCRNKFWHSHTNKIWIRLHLVRSR